MAPEGADGDAPDDGERADRAGNSPEIDEDEPDDVSPVDDGEDGDDEDEGNDGEDGDDEDDGDDGDDGDDVQQVGPVAYSAPNAGGTSRSGEESGGGDDEPADAPPGDEPDPGSIEDVETVVVDPDVVLEGMARNAKLDERAAGKAVLRLEPPFEETVRTEVHHLEEDEQLEDAYHLRPFRFVEEGRGLLDQYPTRELAREELGEDADEAAVEEWLEAAMATWTEYARGHLVDSVDGYFRHGTLLADVEYEGVHGVSTDDED